MQFLIDSPINGENLKQPYPHPNFFKRLQQVLRLSRHWSKTQLDKSYAGETRHLQNLMKTLDLDKGFVVDIAAADGVSNSCTLHLFRDSNWSGLAVEYDPYAFSKLAFAYAGFSDVQLAKCKITPQNVCHLLKAHDVPQNFEFLNLDIDSFDLFVIQAMLQGGFRPKIISIEINEKIPPPIYFTVKYTEGHFWQKDHFFGCSAVAASETIKPFDYVLESIQYNNAFFIHKDLAKGKFNDSDVSVTYTNGYKNKPDRVQLFPWNRDVDFLLERPTEEVVEFLHREFKKYPNMYELRISESD